MRLTGPVGPYPRDPGGAIIPRHIIAMPAPSGADVEAMRKAGRVMPQGYAAT